MNASTCSTCKASTVIAVRAKHRTSGYQIIECPDCDGTGYKKGTPEYRKVKSL